MAWSGNVSPVMRQKAKGTRPKRNAERRAARRVVLSGFPIPPRALTLPEVRDYFSGDRITCMLCGKSYRRISAQHLHQIHSMTEDEYRVRYGLPWRRGLTSQTSRETYSDAVRRRMDEQGIPNVAQYQHLAQAASRRPDPPYRKEQRERNVNGKQLPSPYDKRYVLAEMLRRISDGQTPREIRKDGDMPSLSWLHANLEPQERQTLRAAIWAMPYEYQARAQFGMSPRFIDDIRSLRPLGDAKIAVRLGVTAMTVNKHRRKHGIA